MSVIIQQIPEVPLVLFSYVQSRYGKLVFTPDVEDVFDPDIGGGSPADTEVNNCWSLEIVHLAERFATFAPKVEENITKSTGFLPTQE